MAARKRLLVKNAGAVFRLSWTVKLSLLAALISAADATVQYLISGQPAWVSIGAGISSLGAAVARIIAQQGISELAEQAAHETPAAKE